MLLTQPDVHTKRLKNIFAPVFACIRETLMTCFLPPLTLIQATFNVFPGKSGGTPTPPRPQSRSCFMGTLYMTVLTFWRAGPPTSRPSVLLLMLHSLLSSTCSNIASTHPDAPDLLTVEEVEATIASLSSGKAAGHDSVMNEHIKFGGPSLPPIITLLFNAILLSGYIPVCFRHGVIIPIPKDQRKDQTDPSNYRGISFLSSISKLFEKLILHRLEELQSTLNPLQGGFRKGVSCLHTAFIFQEAVASLREQKKKAYVAFLDVRKAFDTVWHPGLMVKLHSKTYISGTFCSPGIAA